MVFLVDNSTWAVIVVFNPNISKLNQLTESLSAQKCNVVLVNNGDAKSIVGVVNSENAFVIQMPENSGIAKAQNEGISFIRKRGASGFFLFDQDSVIPVNYVDEMLSFHFTPNIGMIVPKVLDVNIQRFIEPRIYYKKKNNTHIDYPKKNLDNEKFRKAAKPIASGCFILMDAVDSIGGMREDFFIDAVDTDFSFRLIENKFDVFQINSITLKHMVGNKTEKSIFGISVNVSNHSPKRRYYIGRNNIWLWKIHHKKMKGISKDILITLGSQLAYSAIESNRIEKVFNMLFGISVGIFTKPKLEIRETD